MIFRKQRVWRHVVWFVYLQSTMLRVRRHHDSVVKIAVIDQCAKRRFFRYRY